MSELIINSIWILHMKNLSQIVMYCFLGLVVEQKTAIYNFIGPRFESWMKELFFSFDFLLGGYFCSSKCPGPAVANFELMINSLMMNRANDTFMQTAFMRSNNPKFLHKRQKSQF